MGHKYKIGQAVVTRWLGERDHVYEIIRRLPEGPDGVPQYRLRSTANRSERVVCEVEIRPAG